MWLAIIVWPDWAIYCTLGNFTKASSNKYVAQIAHIFGNFWFSCKIIFGHIFQTFGDILPVTLLANSASWLGDKNKYNFVPEIVRVQDQGKVSAIKL